MILLDFEKKKKKNTLHYQFQSSPKIDASDFEASRSNLC